MQIPILNGIFTDDGQAEIRTSYPVNLIPVPKQSGISNGYLRPADGLVKNGEGPALIAVESNETASATVLWVLSSALSRQMEP
jgi:hypothetical protein